MPIHTTSNDPSAVEAKRRELEALRNDSLATGHPDVPPPTRLSEFTINDRAKTAGFRPIPSRMRRHTTSFNRITIHHDGMPTVALTTHTQNRERIRQIRNLHVNNNGWGDIGYHYIVDRNGNVWEGRPLTWQGAHVANQNPGNLGVMCLGNFEIERPSTAQFDALTGFVSALAAHHRIPRRNISTHLELASTLCPGRNLQRMVVEARRPGGAMTAGV